MANWLIFGFLLCLSITTQSAPIAKRMVDMTYVFDNTTLHWPGLNNKKFETNLLFNNTVEGGYWFQMEVYSSGTHVGTHMDAPCHFAKGRWCIDEIPLSKLVAPAAVIDIREKVELNPDAVVEVEDLQKWENQTGQTLDETIVMMYSGWGKRWSNRTAFFGGSGNGTENFHYPGLDPIAARWLVDNRRIFGVGSETLSVDAAPARDFSSHRILYDANIFGLENVANMDKIPIYGAKLHVMPMKIGSGSGAPTRIIATFPKIIFGDRSFFSE